MPLDDLFSRLATVRQSLSVAGISDAECNRLSDIEEDTVIDIARRRSTAIPDFLSKLRLFFQIEEEVGLVDGCADLCALKKALLVECARLFDQDRDAALIALCAEWHEIHKWIRAQNGTGACDVGHPLNDRWERSMDRRHALFLKIARTRAKTLAGVEAQAATLPYQVAREAGQPSCDRVERCVANMVASLATIAGAAMPVAQAVPETSKAA